MCNKLNAPHVECYGATVYALRRAASRFNSRPRAPPSIHVHRHTQTHTHMYTAAIQPPHAALMPSVIRRYPKFPHVYVLCMLGFIRERARAYTREYEPVCARACRYTPRKGVRARRTSRRGRRRGALCACAHARTRANTAGELSVH